MIYIGIIEQCYLLLLIIKLYFILRIRDKKKIEKENPLKKFQGLEINNTKVKGI